jgi:long-chain acyl-CoA synthetase
MVDIGHSFTDSLTAKLATVSIHDDKQSVDGKQLLRAIEVKSKMLPQNKCLIAIECDNSIETVVNYLACLKLGHVIALLDKQMESRQFDQFTKDFEPNWILNGFDIRPESTTKHLFHPDLAILLATSGSTGQVKMVKLSHKNLLSNAQSIMQVLPISESHVASCPLPFAYSYALSVIHSHLIIGASLYLTNQSLISPTFWQRFKALKPNSICGVPFSYQMLHKLKWQKLPFDSIEYMTQAGGKLQNDVLSSLKDFCQATQKKLYVMYGQTEATARMTIATLDDLNQDMTTVGQAIPDTLIKTSDDGEVLFKGANVMMGYAISKDCLHTESNIEWLATGDLGMIHHGKLSLSGRKSRLIKYHGNRMSLDYLQSQLGEDTDRMALVQQADMPIIIHTKMVDKRAITERLPFHPNHITWLQWNEIPHTSAGKVDFKKIEQQLIVEDDMNKST